MIRISKRSKSQDRHTDHSFPNKRSKYSLELPVDVIHEIFSRSDLVDIGRSACVSKRWAEASSHADLWNFLNFENCSKISEEQFTKICQRFPNAKKLNIYGVSDMNSLASIARDSLLNLETLDLGKFRLEGSFFPAIQQFAALKKLSVRDATLQDRIDRDIRAMVHNSPLVVHDGLKILEILNCTSVNVMRVVCEQLEMLSVKQKEMELFKVKCPNLREMDVGFCTKLMDLQLRTAVTSCPLLESLDVSYCLSVTEETLGEISLRCTKLVSLDASGNPNITFLTVSFPMLKYLKLLHCGLVQESIPVISSCISLEILELSWLSETVTSISLNNQCLRSIRLTECRGLYELDLGTPMLSLVEISECRSLHRINVFSKAIRKLELRGMQNLSSLSLECQVLEEIHLIECEKLTSFAHDFLVDCPSLKSLLLQSCNVLAEVMVHSSSLSDLSLVDNQRLICLELDCPYLGQLHLEHCNNLKRALLCHAGLQSLNLGICPKLQYLQIDAPQMNTLELKGCGELSELSTCCPVLNSLDASFCIELTDTCLQKMAASSPFLESLTLMSCLSIGSGGIASLHGLAHLTRLDLSYTILTNLQPVFKSCLQLKVLILQACKDLADDSLEYLYRYNALPSLLELDLSHMSLSQSAITELLVCCTRLRHVNLNGCVSLQDLDGCMISMPPPGDSTRCLQSLNCIGCPNFNKFSLSDSGHYALLSSLNLSLSRNLKVVDIASPSLTNLNLSRCDSLGKLKLNCPSLTSLLLQSSSISENVLNNVLSQCPMLAILDVRCCPKINTGSKERLRASHPRIRSL